MTRSGILADGPDDEAGPRGIVVVVGASGGLGGALCRRLLDDPSVGGVVATHRSEGPGAAGDARVRSVRVDVTDAGDVEGLATAAHAHAEALALPVRAVVNCVGILHEDGLEPEKRLEDVDLAALHRLFAVNTVPALLLARHLLPLVPRRGRSLFAAVSARVGSIGDNRMGGWYGYRLTKAALNMALRTLAIEASRRRPDTIVLALHPGTVATALSAPFRGRDAAGVQAPEDAAERLWAVLRDAEAADSGGFRDYAGATVPW